MMLTLTSSFLSLSRLPLIASSDPCTSALISTGSDFSLASAIRSERSSREALVLLESCFSLSYSALFSANSLASFSLSITISVSPAPGTSLRPTIAAGVLGPISFTLVPSSSLIALIRPYVLPTTALSPTLSVPFLMITFATGPKPFSSELSTTTALAFLVGSASSSMTSA